MTVMLAGISRSYDSRYVGELHSAILTFLLRLCRAVRGILNILKNEIHLKLLAVIIVRI